MTDEELLAAVRAAFEAFEPVPGEMRAAARAAFRLRVPEAERAALVRDEDGRVPGLRGGAVRLLTFAVGRTTVEIEVTGAGAVREIAGQLLPPTPARVRVRHRSGVLAGRADTAGQFAMTVPAGPVSLLFVLPDASSIVTSWVRV